MVAPVAVVPISIFCKDFTILIYRKLTITNIDTSLEQTFHYGQFPVCSQGRIGGRPAKAIAFNINAATFNG